MAIKNKNTNIKKMHEHDALWKKQFPSPYQRTARCSRNAKGKEHKKCRPKAAEMHDRGRQPKWQLKIKIQTLRKCTNMMH